MTSKGVKHNELRQLVRSQLESLLNEDKLEAAKAILVPVQPVDIAEAIEGLPQALIQEFKRQEVLDIVDRMSPDDRAKMFDELPAKVVRRLLAQLSPKERQATAILLGYEEDTAGRIMTPEYISLKETLTVSETLARIRSLANASEVVYYLYVTDAHRRLTGVVSKRFGNFSCPKDARGNHDSRNRLG